jgi:molecular chaperone Hsp33
MQDLGQELRANFFTLGVIPDLHFRFVLARNTSIAAEAAHRLGADPALEALVGETMLAAFLLVTHSVKTDETVSLHLECSGPVHRLIGFARVDGGMRGTTSRPGARWSGPLWDGVGTGILRVNRWRNSDARSAYSSAVEMRKVGLDRNLEEFVGRSDQIQSFIRLETSFEPDPTAGSGGLRVRNVSGYMFQALPGAGPDEVDRILEMIGGRAPDEMISAILDPTDMAGGSRRPDPKAIHPVNILKNGSFHYQCDCSKDKVNRMLYLMGRESIVELVQERGCVEVFCEFCKKRYELSPREVDRLFQDR